jgi:hypothetical protein
MTTCPKCESQMVAGFTPDFTHAAVLQSSWIEGQPEKNWLGSIKFRGRKQLPISAHRCARCGFLEFYASPV